MNFGVAEMPKTTRRINQSNPLKFRLLKRLCIFIIRWKKVHNQYFQEIEKLEVKISDAKIARALEDTAFDYGFHADRLQEVLNYWKGDYLSKWNERQEYLNQFPQFTTKIQG